MSDWDWRDAGIEPEEGFEPSPWERKVLAPGDRVVYSPSCQGTVVRVSADGVYVVRLDSGSIVTTGNVRLVSRIDTWVVARRKHHYREGSVVRYGIFRVIAARLGHLEIWEEG